MGQIIQPTSDDPTDSVIAMKDDGQLTGHVLIFAFLQTNITSQMWPNGGRGDYHIGKEWIKKDREIYSSRKKAGMLASYHILDKNAIKLSIKK